MPKYRPRQGAKGAKQDVGTPRCFLDAVTDRFGPIDFDLAAHERNAVVPRFYSPSRDTFKHTWELDGNLWLNPEFRNIRPYAQRCYESAGRGRRIMMLTPASVGSDWFFDSA